MNWLSQISRIAVAVVVLSISLMFDVACLLGQDEDDLSVIAKSWIITARGKSIGVA